ncbi:VWA domain-containing protein [Clostridium celatum]|uniref:von Willebrand factor type A domain protein n=1 Tax=Clostridium celatum DSM 1785 TaxID=545697 RepID=L1QQ77_9CLOT|nr:VWA domain-containing protein [Clostridium celatum]EKY29815.1 von Willebrand factor type A domain protein [Clostridium celatum DSM 1785]
MKKSTKKLLAMVMSAMMVTGFLPSNVLAEEKDGNEKANVQELTYEKTNEVKVGEKYVIVYDNKTALSNNENKVVGKSVEVTDEAISNVDSSMIWTVDEENHLLSEAGKYLDSELNLVDENGVIVKFGENNISYAVEGENETTTNYLSYNEEKWLFDSNANEAITYYEVKVSEVNNDEATTNTTEGVEEEVVADSDNVATEDSEEVAEDTTEEVATTLTEEGISTLAETTTTYEYVLDTDGVDSGAEYLIVAADSANALTNNDGKIASTVVTVSENKVTNANGASLWTFTSSNNGYTVKNGNYYLRLKSGWNSYNINLSSRNNYRTLNVSNNNGNYTISYEDYYLSYSSSKGFTASDSSSTVRLYKKVVAADDKLYPDDTTNGGDYPQYPNEGSVKINKGATSTDFNGTGVAKVELGVTGVPVKKGVDVVLLFDVSTSMKDPVSANDSTTKLKAAKDAATQFVDILLGDNDDGTKSNNRLALVTFAGWENEAGNEVLYGLKNAEAKNSIKSTINSITNTYSGTDYDYAFEKANEILATADSNRETYVVFMTDGAPSEYTGTNGTRYVWSSSNTSNLVNGANNNLLKGAEDAKTSGAKVYSIGFGLTNATSNNNNGFTPNEAKAILNKISSGTNYYVSADSQTEINTAFSNIAMQIRKAGTNAVVTDKLGASFNLQTTNTIPNNNGEGGTKPLGFDPTIEVLEYDLYTKVDYNNGTCTFDQIGSRKSTTPTIVEKVTFNADGTVSSTLKDGNIKDSNGNIVAEKFTYNISDETFTWTIGDITQKEITLNYYVYLEGSMEGDCSDGLYDTNEYAKLNYTNYLGNDSNKTFEKPKMPWGAAQVTYEFYLVNEKGEPVNAQGIVIPFEYRVKVSDPRSLKFNWNNGTTVTGEVVAKDLVPAGYDLHIDDAAYTVHAVSSGTGSYEIIGTLPEGQVQSTKLISGSYDAQFTHSAVAFGVVYSAKLIPDTIVLDYGKSVNIDVIKNDLTQNAKLYSIANKNETNLDDVVLGSGQTASGKFNTTTVTNNNGRAEIVDGIVKYTPTKMMDSIDKFYYSAEVATIAQDGSETKFYQYQELTVIPATTVYYEDNFAQNEKNGGGIAFSGAWTTVTDEATNTSNTNQDNGTVFIDGHPYGYDSSYTGDNKFSGGTSHVVVGTKNADTTASFTFKGTGFDLISRTDTNSTSIIIQVRDLDNNKLVSSKKLNNYYASGILYQIPVHKVTDLPYGNYEVKIIVGQSMEAATFYLDAIRIYNPLGLSNEDNKDFDEANKQYAADKEANAVIQEVRNMLIKANDFDVNSTNPGVVFVDKNSSAGIEEYKNVGPNNEVYLAKGQSIAFNIPYNADLETVQVGMKAPNGETNVKVGGTTTSAAKDITIKTATDMYYDITGTLTLSGDKYIVVITNNTDNIISITNLKMTFSKKQTSTIEITSDEDTLEVAKILTEGRVNGMSEDVNNDGVVDIVDLAIVAKNYNSRVVIGEEDNIYKSDIIFDGVIDLFDLTTLSKKL